MINREARFAWAKQVLKMYFTDPVFVGEEDNSAVFEVECICNRTLKLILWDINKSMHNMGYYAQFSIWNDLISGDVEVKVRGIQVKWFDVWEMNVHDLSPWMMNCIVRSVVKRRMPYDDLFKVNLGGEDVDRMRYETEDGLGIKADDIDFDVKIEAIEYRGCDGNPDDPDYHYELIPCLWCYTGHISSFRFQGLANEFGLALGKAVKAAYRGAKKWEMETLDGKNIAEMIENNTVKWRTYGYCY